MSELRAHMQKGLALAFVLGLVDLGFAALILLPDDGGGQPPVFVILVGLVVSLATVIGVPLTWRSGNQIAFWMVVASRIVAAVTNVPAFFDGAPPLVLVVLAIEIVLTAVCLVLWFKPSPERALT